MWPFNRKQSIDNKGSCMSEKDKLRALSFLPPEDAKVLGRLPNQAICGFMSGEGFSSDQFHPNCAFIDFMHQVIRESGPSDPSMQAAAAEQGTGWIYVIDLRTPDGPQGRVPSEDIIGGFEVKNGRLSSDGYWSNNQHLVFSVNGLMQLPPRLQMALIERLKKCRDGTH